MSNKLVYDLPTRIFHWCFAFLFVFSFFVAKVIDDDSSLYAYHMLSGIMMSLIVVVRIIWGLIGTTYAKFSSFMLKPSDLIVYFKSMVAGKTKRYMGHNPASSYAAIAMFAASLGMVATGILMSNRFFKDFFEEIHELIANGFVVIALLHIAGVLFHQLKHKDNIALSIVNGKKQNIEGKEGINSPKWGVAILFVTFIISSSSYLLSSYNTSTQKLSLPVIELQLGESEGDHKDNGHSKDDD